MRVLVIAENFPAPGQPGGGIVVMRQVQALSRLGHDILVVRVVPFAPPLTSKWRAYGDVPERYVVEGIDVRTIRALFAPRMVGMEFLPLQVGGALRKLVREFSAEVVHAHCVIPSGQLAASQDRPTVLTAHGSDAYDWAWRRAGLRQAAAYGIAQADAVVAVSDFIRENVRALFNRDVSVVYNGADETVFAPASRSVARDQLQISDDRFVIAFAGRPPRNKGAFVLIDAASNLSEFRPLLLLAGPTQSDKDLLRVLSSNRVDYRLCGMLGHEELARVICASDVFCLPSYREGLPLAVCEAMLSGRPIVATTVGGIPEIVRDGVEGYLVPSGDARLLANRLRMIAEDPGGSRQMGKRAHDFAAKHLTWRSNAESYDRIYRRISNAAA